MTTLMDCNTCRIYPCVFIKQGEPMEVKGCCSGYKCDLDKVIIEILEIAKTI